MKQILTKIPYENELDFNAVITFDSIIKEAFNRCQASASESEWGKNDFSVRNVSTQETETRIIFTICKYKKINFTTSQSMIHS